MIVGIGVDIVHVARISRAWARFGRRFAGKILSDAELETLLDRADPDTWLAKRFAAKEAVAKALGTGMRGGVHFPQIRVERGVGGAPRVSLSGAAKARADTLGVSRVHVTLSDEREYSVAFAVLER